MIFPFKDSSCSKTVSSDTCLKHTFKNVRILMDSVFLYVLFCFCCAWFLRHLWSCPAVKDLTVLFFSASGVTEWETLFPSLDLFSDGAVRSVNADRLEPVPLSHLPLQNLFCPQPALPLLPVSIVYQGFLILLNPCCLSHTDWTVVMF